MANEQKISEKENQSEIENKDADGEVEKGESDLGGEMSLLDHLDELRMRIVWGVVGIIVGSVIAGVFINYLMDWILLSPANLASMELQNLRPFGQPFLYFKIILFAGIIISFPFLLYQLWRFVSPGLYSHEKNWVGKITFFTTICFFAGVFFSYFVMIPAMLRFASGFGTEQIKNIIDINEYFSFVITIVLASGLLFELPMVAYALSRIGLLTPKTMRKYRRHGIIVILIIAAILTPTPDPISQLIFAAPLFGLYELSILISGFAMKKYESS